MAPNTQTPLRPGAERPTRLASFLMSFVYAWRGITYVARTQRNARVHLAVAVAVAVAAVLLGLSTGEDALLALTIALVIAFEALNTVVEAIVDLVTQEYHPLAKVAKDAAAGAVLVMALGAVGVGLLTLGPHLLRLLAR